MPVRISGDFASVGARVTSCRAVSGEAIGVQEPSFLTAALSLTVDPKGIAAIVGFYASKRLRVLTGPQILGPSL